MVLKVNGGETAPLERPNKTYTIFSQLGAKRAIGNDSTTVPQIRRRIIIHSTLLHFTI